MRIPVHLPPPLAQRAGEAVLNVDAATVRGALQALDGHTAGLYDAICAENGQLRPHVLVYHNQEDVRFGGGLNNALQPGDTLHVIAAVSGG